MKQRILTLSLVFLFAVATVFTGCKKDDPSNPAAPQNPTVTLNSDPGFTATSSTVAPGSAFKFGFVAVPYSGSKIVEYKVTYAYDGGAPVVIVDSAGLSLTSLAKQYSKTTRTVAGSETYAVTVTDKNGQTATTSFKLTVIGAGMISTQTSKLVGAQSNLNAGSFYAASTGTVYKEGDAKTNSSLVDFVYYYGQNNLATLASLDDASTASVFSSTSTWSPKNATKLTLSSMSTADFDAITDDSKIALQTTPSTSLVTKLATGSIVAFETAAHKKGLIKIGTINGTTAGDMTITVKVQQ